MELTDSFGRKIEYLRLSVTDRCNLNCLYCSGSKRCGNEITPSQTAKLCRLFYEIGIKKVRLTGGEPLIRDDIETLVERVARNPFDDISLTTNGILLKDKALALKKAGLKRVNISLDSLDQNLYKSISGANSLNKVLDGIPAALDAGLTPVKLNIVLLKSINASEAERFINLANEMDIEVRFIEYMPIDNNYDQSLLVTKEEFLNSFPFLKPLQQEGSVASLFKIDGKKGKIGFISSVSNPFCESCNRIRITSDLNLRFCLGDDNEISIKDIIEDNNIEKAKEQLINLIYKKPKEGFCSGFKKGHGMKSIGG